MPYTIGYSQRRTGPFSETTEPTAQDALKTVIGLEMSDETIRLIRAPWGWEIGKEELKMYAEEETKSK